MSEFEVNGVVLAYDEFGDPAGPPLLLLHGLSSARTTWVGLVPELSEGRRVVTLDHRGHGESSHAPGTYDLAHYGPDAVAFCEQVVGDQALVVGHSLGGVIAHYLGLERPDLVRGLVLEDPPMYFGEPSDEPPRGVAAFFPMLRQLLGDMRDRGAPLEEYEGIVRAAPALNGSGGTMADVLGEEGTRHQAEGWSRLDPEVFTPAIEGGALAGLDTDVPVKCPVRILRADPGLGAAFSPAHEARYVATNPHAVVEMVSGASHAIHDEQPGPMLTAILEEAG
jgi:pimeloyl-ACP methyl ester carboxylesterase